LLGRNSTTWASPSALFALVIFEIASCIYARAGWSPDPPICTGCTAGMTGAHHHTQFIDWGGGLANSLPRLPLNPNPSNLSLPSSWNHSCKSPHLATSFFWLKQVTWLNPKSKSRGVHCHLSVGKRQKNQGWWGNSSSRAPAYHLTKHIL
jgi:hypothetical protein